MKPAKASGLQSSFRRGAAKGFTLVESTNGLFVSTPSEKGKDGKYYEKILMSSELKTELNDIAISHYNQLEVS